MNAFIRNYCSYPRIAKVIRKLESITSDYDCLVIKNDVSYFQSDRYIVPNENINKIAFLADGDIVTVDSRGVVFRLFSAEENDATIYLTGHCNSNCVMCPCSDNERKLSEGLDDEWMQLYLAMLPSDLRHIIVTGGEPTLRLDTFMKVIKYIGKRFPNIDALLLTNGRSLAYPRLADFLLQNAPKNLIVGIPLHGDNQDLHDKITRARGSFQQTDLGIKNLLQRKMNVELRIVVTRLNLDNLYDIAKRICRDYSTVKVVNFVGLETRGNCAVNLKDVYINYREVFEHSKMAIKVLIASGIEVGLYNFPLCMVDEGYWKLCKRSISPEKVRYTSQCITCSVRNICGGFFNTTLSMVKPGVNPINN